MFNFPQHLKCAIFDMDGTILDSMGMWQDIDREFLEKRGIPFTPEYGEAMKGRNYQEGALYSIETYHLNETVEDLIIEWDNMAREYYRSRLKLKPGAAQYIKSLKERGIRIALATVSSAEFYTLAMTANGVMDLFDFMTDATVVKRGKGFPDLYEYVAEQLKVLPKECLVFEDTLHSLKGAKAGGFHTCAVYDKASHASWEELKKLSDYALLDFNEGIL